MKKFLTVAFALTLVLVCLFVLPLEAQAAERTVVDNGTCGENLTWTLYDDGELVISGVGSMKDYTISSGALWKSHRSSQVQYTVKFQEWDGNVIATQTYYAGQKIVPPADPVRRPDNIYTYTFAGWKLKNDDQGPSTPVIPLAQQDLGVCTGDATYIATYTFKLRDYAVTFQYEDGTVIERKTYHWGDTVTAPADPEAPEGYVFKGWTPEITVCQGDAVYTAVFEQLLPAPHVVTWVQVTTSLEGNIGLNFYVKLSDSLVNDPTTAMRFVVNGVTMDVPLSQAVQVGDQYKFTCPVSAKNMADNVNAQIVTSDGPVGDAKNLAVMTYCNYMIQYSTDTKLVSLMKAMLNYGASAQILFNHNTDNLANASLSEADRQLADVDASAYAHSVSGSEAGIQVYNATLLLETETTARIYFKLTGSKTIDRFTFKVDGQVVQAKANGELYYVEIPNIAAQHLDQMHTVTLGGLTIRYGGLSYVNQVIKNPQYATEAMTNAAKALFAYNKMAEYYFN